MKKIIYIIIGVVILLGLGIYLLFFGFSTKESRAFMKEYESLNGTTNATGKEYRTINIKRNNPFVKVSAEEIVEKLKNKETFYVYFGDPLCPWCRSVIEKFIEVAEKNNIETVYYVKIWDENGKEILRNKYEIDGTDIEEVIEGTPAYESLIEAFDTVLDEYVLTGDDEEKIELGEKRIFAPNFIYVKEGNAEKMVDGISEKQTDPRGELTEEILKDEEEMFNDFFKN